MTFGVGIAIGGGIGRTPLVYRDFDSDTDADTDADQIIIRTPLLDLFPQTYHIESISVFQREK